MTTNFTIAAGLFGLIAIATHRESTTSVTWLFTTLAGISFLCALYANFKKTETDTYFEERKFLLNSALEIIDARTRLNVKMVATFKDTFKQYKYSLTEEQKEFISSLFSAVDDVRINNEELTGLDVCKERTELISQNRSLLNKIEKSRLVIEEYLSET